MTPDTQALREWCLAHVHHHVKPMLDDDGCEVFLACFTCDPDNDFALIASAPDARLVEALESTDSVPAPFSGNDALVDVWHARGRAIRAALAQQEPTR